VYSNQQVKSSVGEFIVWRIQFAPDFFRLLTQFIVQVLGFNKEK
jgi:hypothetical protein